MNNKKYDFIIDIINIILKFFICFSVIGIILALFTKDVSLVLKSFLLIPAPVISYLAGRYFKHLWSFLAIHLLLGVIYTFLSSILLVQIIYVIYIALLTLFELQTRMKLEKQQKLNTSIFFIAVFFIMYLINDYVGLIKLNQLTFTLAIFYVLLYLLNMYLINFDNYFRNHSNISNIPMGQIVSTNNTLILFFGGFCIFVMLLFTHLPLNRILSAISKLLIAMIKAFAAIFSQKGEDKPLESYTIDSSSENPVFPGEAGVTSPIWEFIQKLFLGLVSLIVIAALIALLAYGLYKLYQRFYAKKANNFRDQTEFISPFEKHSGIKRETDKTRKRFWNIFTQSNNDRIRRLFYKRITASAADIDHPELLTPTRLSQLILSKEQGIIKKNAAPDKVNQLTELYEKARYSKEDCTKEEVQRVKNILQ